MGTLSRLRNSPRLNRARPWFEFFAAWAFLNAMLNLRFPAPEPPFWWLAPSLDVVLLFSVLALLPRAGWRLPRAVRAFLVTLLMAGRFLRLGDAIQNHYFLQPFNAYMDLPLLPELVRLLHSSLPAWQFYPLLPAALGALACLAWLSWRALGVAERRLAEPRFTLAAGAVALVTVGSASWPRDAELARLTRFGFGASVVPRLRGELAFVLNVARHRSEVLAQMVARQAELARIPHDLGRLDGANVFLVFVESYGEAALRRPELRQRLAPIYDRLERELAARDFSLVSSVLDSSTSGGRSWLAHTTLLSGLRTEDQLTFGLALSEPRRTLPGFFRDAGYTTIAVEPGTTRERPVELFQFDQRYGAAAFHYAGPPFAWATMPDQFVLDFVRRRENFAGRRRVFAKYVLVSSHAPWSQQPVLVEDWDTLGDGALFGRVAPVRFDVQWPEFRGADAAYAHSIAYDLDVLGRYLAAYVRDDSLFIVLGDHQPVPDLARDTGLGVPIHVLCREPSRLEPFRRRGYEPGLRPRPAAHHVRFEDFLAGFLRDFSRDG